MSRHDEIAEMLRAQIRSGELPPGSRLPSTRAMVAEFGIAMATATRVIDRLRRDGLVEPIVGRGTIVCGRDARSPSAASERIAGGRVAAPDVVAVAIEIADDESVDAVSMRRVAASLGVTPMALYRHVTDRAELVDRMMTAVWATLRLPPEHLDWRDDLRDLHHRVWDLFGAHPWLATSMSLTRPQPIATAMPFTERCLRALRRAGLEQQSAFTAYIALFAFTRGLAAGVAPERAAEARTGIKADAWVDRTREELVAGLAQGHYPEFAAIVGGGYDNDLSTTFGVGLDAMIAGLHAQVTEVAGSGEPDGADVIPSPRNR